MNKTKKVIIVGFALFSMFFGAGNLVLPPFLGSQAGPDWMLVTLGFVITAVAIPILGILAYAKLQGTMFDFGKKVSPIFSYIYCFFVYVISITLPAPRTASVTHEIAIAPIFGSRAVLTSGIYFILVYLFVIHRSKIINLIGKFFTPLIVIILLCITVVGLLYNPNAINPSVFETPLIIGLLEGYQTFDTIGAVVVGGVIVISIRLNDASSYSDSRSLIRKSGILAGICLLIIYANLILVSALYNATFDPEATRTEILIALSTQTLGKVGTSFLSVLVALACFTTAVGIITGTADYVKGLFNGSESAYIATAVTGCIIGVGVGQFDVHFIIDIALPALMFIYPITIVLIALNLLPDKFASKIVFRAVVLITFIFSIPDFLKFIIPIENIEVLINNIPLAKNSLGWVIPAILTFFLLNIKTFTTNTNKTLYS